MGYHDWKQIFDEIQIIRVDSKKVILFHDNYTRKPRENVDLPELNAIARDLAIRMVPVWYPHAFALSLEFMLSGADGYRFQGPVHPFSSLIWEKETVLFWWFVSILMKNK